MSGSLPELGSKISLISKADIRYEGRLYTVDPQECTIALSSVRSFGTEDRETQFQIAPQSQIYDYILFRGSDIKDIRVVNSSLPHPNDPAIMQVQLPNGQHLMPHFSMPTMNAPPGGYPNPFGGMGGIGNLNMGGNGTGGPPPMAPGSGMPTPFMVGNQPPQQQPPQMSQQSQQHQQHQQQLHQQKSEKSISVLDMLTSASRSTTPISLISRKSPPEGVNVGDIGMPMNQQQQQQQQHQNQQQQQQQNHHNQNQQNQNNAGHGGNARDAGHKRQNHQQRTGGGGGSGGNTNHHNNNNNNNMRDRRDQGRNMSNNYNLGDFRYNYNNQPRGNNRTWVVERGQNNSNNMMRNRGRGGGGGGGNNGGGGGGAGGRGRMQNQGFRPMGPAGNQNKPRNPKNTIKFDQDYDFEQANNRFEELRLQFAKLPLDGQKITLVSETDKKDDSGNETGAGEHEPEDETAANIAVGYDKTKSFFDNISCEAAQDRTKNKKKNDWIQERKLNSETFGVASTRRGSYRGRANYFNRNAGMFGGGGGGNNGYNRNYRTGNNYRNRSNNRSGPNGGGAGGHGVRDKNDTKSNANTNANNNANTDANNGNSEATTNAASNVAPGNNLKSQTKQLTSNDNGNATTPSSASATNPASSSESAAATATPTIASVVKSMPPQENNATPSTTTTPIIFPAIVGVP